MKRLQLTLLFLILATTSLLGQNRNSDHRRGDISSFRADREELRDFEQELDRFSFAMITNNPRAARYAKYQIQLDMEREIDQAYRNLRALNYRFEAPRYSKREPEWRTPRLETRGNGIRQNNRTSNREIARIVHRLEKQEHLYYMFSELRLERRTRGIQNEDEHRRIMYQFLDTMEEELFEHPDVRGRVTHRGR